jgi:hypothetical protein
MTNESITIKAKFNGKCTRCGSVIFKGQSCVWTKGAGVRCIDGQCMSSPATNVALESHTLRPKSEVTVTMGVFRKDNRVYVVKPNKDKTRCYAKEIVESPARMTENGEVVDFEAIYRPGMIYKLSESDRWDLADAADFLTKYSKCIVCSRSLKAAKSVAGAIGPVCAKYFAHSNGAKSQPTPEISHVEIEDEGQRDEADDLENEMLAKAELREDHALWGDAQ